MTRRAVVLLATLALLLAPVAVFAGPSFLALLGIGGSVKAGTTSLSALAATEPTGSVSASPTSHATASTSPSPSPSASPVGDPSSGPTSSPSGAPTASQPPAPGNPGPSSTAPAPGNPGPTPPGPTHGPTHTPSPSPTPTGVSADLAVTAGLDADGKGATATVSGIPAPGDAGAQFARLTVSMSDPTGQATVTPPGGCSTTASGWVCTMSKDGSETFTVSTPGTVTLTFVVSGVPPLTDPNERNNTAKVSVPANVSPPASASAAPSPSGSDTPTPSPGG